VVVRRAAPETLVREAPVVRRAVVVRPALVVRRGAVVKPAAVVTQAAVVRLAVVVTRARAVVRAARPVDQRARQARAPVVSVARAGPQAMVRPGRAGLAARCPTPPTFS
jgi:hypothetical protein